MTSRLAALCLTIASFGQNIVTTFAGTQYIFDRDAKKAVNASLGVLSTLLSTRRERYISPIKTTPW